MQQSGVGKHHGRARGDATAVRRHRSARRLALPAYPSDSCFDSHLAPSERSLVSSESTTYIVRCSPQTSSSHRQGTWAAELWVLGQGFGPPSECQQETRDLAVTSEPVCFVRSSARKNPVSPLVFRMQFSQVRDWASRHFAERSRSVPRQGTVQGGLCPTLHIVKVQKVRGV